MKKLKNQKWRKWKPTNEEIENLQMKELKTHEWRKWKPTNQESEKLQMKKLKNHKWRNWKPTNGETEKSQTKNLKIINAESYKYPIEFQLKSQFDQLESSNMDLNLTSSPIEILINLNFIGMISKS